MHLRTMIWITGRIDDRPFGHGGRIARREDGPVVHEAVPVKLGLGHGADVPARHNPDLDRPPDHGPGRNHPRRPPTRPQTGTTRPVLAAAPAGRSPAPAPAPSALQQALTAVQGPCTETRSDEPRDLATVNFGQAQGRNCALCGAQLLADRSLGVFTHDRGLLTEPTELWACAPACRPPITFLVASQWGARQDPRLLDSGPRTAGCGSRPAFTSGSRSSNSAIRIWSTASTLSPGWVGGTRTPPAAAVVGRRGIGRRARSESDDGRAARPALEVLTKALDVSVGDEAGGEAEEGFVDVVPSFPADA